MDKNRRKSEKRKIIVAMSGGLDSSVAAVLLKQAGFNVVGVFMKFWSAPHFFQKSEGWNRCCSPESEKRARLVAKTIGIPFYVFSFEKEFKKRIVDYFLREYKAGRTPNPCVVCNKEIKFGLLLKKALSLDVDYVATGHYARIGSRKWKAGSKKLEQLPSTYCSLLTSKDKNRDQSYFLWMLNQEQLKRILFPVGDYTRAEIEKIARKFKLPVLNIKKSVEVCFVQTTVNGFLKKYLKSKPGKIVDAKRKILGKHESLWLYTIGQRRGIGLPGGPYYVLDKDLKRNFLIVTKNEKGLYRKELITRDVNWIFAEASKSPLRVMAKIRYRHQPVLATLTYNLKLKAYNLKFDKPQRAITPGQSVVFCKGEEVLGGGIVEK